MTKTAISAKDARKGDTLDTFQHGRIVVADIDLDRSPINVTITTIYGLVWTCSRDQLVSRITF